MKKALLVSLVALAACQRGESPKPDSALAADLARANQLQIARAVPQFSDSAPRAEAPAAAPEPRRVASRIESAPRVRVTPRSPVVTQPAPVEVEPVRSEPAAQLAGAPASQAGFAVGATFALASQQRICTSTNRPGDRFVATVTNSISGSNGALIPAGSNVVIDVVSVAAPGNGSDGAISFSVHSIELNGRNYPVAGDVFSTEQLERVRLNPESDRKKVAGGAVAGALIGQLMKKNTKGTVIGAAAGAATGAVAAKLTEKYDGCLPVGSPMRLTLSSALLM